MKKALLVMFLAVFASSCSLGATPTPVPTSIPTSTPIPPTPVGYGVEFPFNADQIKEWRENVSVTCEQIHEKQWLDPDMVRNLVAAGGKLDITMGENTNLVYLWTGNVPLELFIEPEEGAGFGTYYDYWGTSYCVSGLEEDVNGWGSYIIVITKIVPQ